MTVTAKHMTIPKTIDQDVHVNYDAMLKEAIGSIGEMAGDNWTNYNPSDPGITILEFMCYGLLDLGYKSSFSMKDLLSDKEDKIKTRNRLYTTRQILFSNPLTNNDFRKFLIDRVEEVKNVWIEKNQSNSGFDGTYEVSFELTDELKSEWLTINNNNYVIEKDSNEEAVKAAFKERIKEIIDGISGLLYQHRNLGTIYFRPTVLVPMSLWLEGTFYLTKSSDLEKSVARIYFTLNNYLSRFIEFHTYDQMKKDGSTVGEIMEGPKLSYGFIKDKDLLPRLTTMDTTAMKTLLVEVNSISSVFGFAVDLQGAEKKTGKIKIPNNTSPFFDYTKAAELLSDKSNPFELYHGEQRISHIDQSKVNAYYQSLTQKQAVSNFGFKENLGPQMPEGKFRNVRQFQSLQQLFPALYGLQTTHNLDGLSRERRAQIKQLKAYVMLFEQIIADHQAQMAGFDNLLSFNSGVKAAKPLCQTYFSQGLYDSPGAELILRAYDLYKNESHYLSEYPDTNWKTFKADQSNLYEDRLAKTKVPQKENIKRKNKMLSHVYARLGQDYDLEPLLELNPKYGDYNLARVENISAMLKNFSLYGGNLSRSYFLPEHLIRRHRKIKGEKGRNDLFTGIEYKFGLLLQLNHYYKGIIDVMSRWIENQDPNVEVDTVFLNQEKEESGWDYPSRYLLVRYYGNEILKLPDPNRAEPVGLIREYLEPLRLLSGQTKGFILIDNSLLVDNLQNDNWTIIKDGKPVPLKKKGNGNEITTVNLRQTQRVVESQSSAWANEKVSIVNSGGISSDISEFNGTVSLYLPQWVSRLAESDFQSTFLTQFAKEGPVQLVYQLNMLDKADLMNLLSLRKSWLAGNHSLQQGKEMPEESLSATREIASFIINHPTDLKK